eukprot:Skav206860  [mRNA]  locus=scaffold1667:345775:346104:- [translate_table: standard]
MVRPVSIQRSHGIHPMWRRSPADPEDQGASMADSAQHSPTSVAEVDQEEWPPDPREPVILAVRLTHQRSHSQNCRLSRSLISRFWRLRCLLRFGGALCQSTGFYGHAAW